MVMHCVCAVLILHELLGHCSCILSLESFTDLEVNVFVCDIIMTLFYTILSILIC